MQIHPTSNSKMLLHHLFLSSTKPNDCEKVKGQLVNQPVGDDVTWTDGRMKGGRRKELPGRMEGLGAREAEE